MPRYTALRETKSMFFLPSRFWTVIIINLLVATLLLGRSTADRIPIFDLGTVGDTPGILFLFALSMLLVIGLPFAVLRSLTLNRRAVAAILTYQILSIWMLVSMMLSPLNLGYYGLNKVLLAGPGIALLLLTSVAILQFNDPRVIKGLFMSLIIWCLIIALLSTGDHAGRFAALGGGPNVFGRFMVLGALASLAMWEGNNARRYLLLSATFWIFAMLSQSRGVFIGMILIFSLIAMDKLYEKVLRSKRKIRVSAIVPMLIVLVVLIWPSEVTNQLRTRLVDFLFTDLPGSYAVISRITGFELALSLFWIRPLVGWGPGGFAEFGILAYPHNLVLEVMAEFGLIGLITLLVYFGLAMVPGSPRDKLMHIYYRYAWLMALFCFITAQFSGDIFDSRLFFFFGFVAAALASGSPLRGNSERRDQLDCNGTENRK